MTSPMMFTSLLFTSYVHCVTASLYCRQVDKKMANAYYWRGVTKVKLKQPRGVQDFNKALAIDGKIFQVHVQ